ncbi:TPA: four helix bundle protein [Candidatus Nomurabacteria bacterium]|nr:MAG: CHP02436-containing protein [Candidatus Nomurabacteria bacterium GW2011_GWE2_36_115]KKP93537.1 MAG: CHP02436-containing protein [Candidatus Nomurabacteria bacterium GW2011_GWF2_36_126]KKP97087.1 MAG: CHP02436-containing protein [Candidatus Nomurabacteria bacterium GW2011_GWD2_36_14]KKP98911.1 MAG: CHP02436-containing protein [Candidatus Nomurabacteria bacterium GW2011_GWF2_36_19]KKQ05952.1 MAG: CHP02436-containing protein [Candidatus Nomurabacteria bacterium GW2011_GWF1_36_47]KKQ08867.
MKGNNIIREKSYSFSLKIIKIYQELTQEKKEFILSKQLIRSGTSIGANIEESTGAQSKNDFIAKLSISYKETWETLYWLRLLTDSGFLNKKQSDILIFDCEELLKILGAILKTSKS